MRYGPYTKQEFYSDVLAAWNDTNNETHSDVVNALLNDKYSWGNLKSHYQSKYSFKPFPKHHPSYGLLRIKPKDVYDMDFGKRAITHWRATNHPPAMTQKVSGAVRAMRNRDIHLPPKQNKHEVDFASLRCG